MGQRNIYPAIPSNYNALKSNLSTSSFYSSPNFCNLSYQGFSGIRKNVRSLFLNYQRQLNSARYKSFLEIAIQSDKNGLYLNQNRFYLGYKVEIPLAENTYLGAGVQLGIFNDVIDENPSGVSNSKNIIDGNLGVHIRYKKSFLAISAKQVFNSQVTPIHETLALETFYDITGCSNLRLNSALSLRYGGMYRRIINHYDRYGVYSILTLQEQFGFGLNFGNLNGLELLLRLYQSGKLNKVDAGLNFGLLKMNELSNTGHFNVYVSYYWGHLSTKNE